MVHSDTSGFNPFFKEHPQSSHLYAHPLIRTAEVEDINLSVFTRHFNNMHAVFFMNPWTKQKQKIFIFYFLFSSRLDC